jgi:hypothetical protein
MARILILFLGALGLAFLAGCGPDIQDYHYRPHPAIAVVPSTQPDVGSPVEVLATIVGIHRQGNNSPPQYFVDARLRAQNYSDHQVAFDPRTLELTNSELVRFGPPQLSATQLLPVRPDEPVTVSATFPFPSGIPADKLDLSSLTLRWALDIDGNRFGQIVTFHRVIYYEPAYWGPGWGPGWNDPFYPYPYGFYGGVVIVHHHR